MKYSKFAVVALAAAVFPLAIPSRAQTNDDYWGIPAPAERAKKETKMPPKRVKPPKDLSVRKALPARPTKEALARASESVLARKGGERKERQHYIIFFKRSFFPYEDLAGDNHTEEFVTREGKTLTEVADRLVKAAKGELVHVYPIATGGFSALLTEQAAADFAALPEIDSVALDDVREPQAMNWGRDRVDQKWSTQTGQTPPPAYTATTGAGVHVYVVDTGIRGNHPEFTNRLGAGWPTDGSVNPYEDKSRVFNPETQQYVVTGHGTHVAGIAGGTTVGVAPGVTLHSIRVSDASGTILNSLVVAACVYLKNPANRQMPAVINLSLGGKADPIGSGYGQIDNAVLDLINQGLTVVIAAGNSGQLARDYSPAHVVEAITVGAAAEVSDQQGFKFDQATGFSNYGLLIDVWAPGYQVESAWHDPNKNYEILNGTSMAAPHVAGAVAHYLQTHPSAPPDEVRSAIVANGTKGAIGPLSNWSNPAQTTSRYLYLGREWVVSDVVKVEGGADVVQWNKTMPNNNVADIFRLTSSTATVHSDPGQLVRMQWVDENGDLVYAEMSGPGNLTVTLSPYQGNAVPAKYNIAETHAHGRANFWIEGATANTYFTVYTSGSLTDPGAPAGFFKFGASSYHGIADVSGLRIDESTHIARISAGNAIFTHDAGLAGILAPFTYVTQRLVIRDLKTTGGLPLLVCAQPSPLSMDGGRVILAGGDMVQTGNWQSWRVAAANPGPYNGVTASSNPGYTGLFSNSNIDSWNRPTPALPLSGTKLTWSMQWINSPLPPGYSQPQLPWAWYPNPTTVGQTAP